MSALVSWMGSASGLDIAGETRHAVTLCVGGEYIVVLRKTLLEFQDRHAFFAEALSGSGRRTHDGACIVDRDPATFTHLLNYLRNDKVLLLPDGFDHWDLLLADARFCQLTELEAAIEESYDYQQRCFRRQLPRGVVLTWSQPVSSSSSAAAANGGHPSQDVPVGPPRIALTPPVPAFTVDQCGVLIHQTKAVTTAEEAAAILSTTYGYAITQWRQRKVPHTDGHSGLANGNKNHPLPQPLFADAIDTIFFTQSPH